MLYLGMQSWPGDSGPIRLHRAALPSWRAEGSPIGLAACAVRYSSQLSGRVYRWWCSQGLRFPLGAYCSMLGGPLDSLPPVQAGTQRLLGAA